VWFPCLLEAAGGHTLQQKVSFQQPSWLITELSDSSSVATDIATEQEVAITLHRLVAQLSDVGNEPFDFLYSTGDDFHTPSHPPGDFKITMLKLKIKKC